MRSSLPVAKVRPSGVKATDFTAPVWPVRTDSRAGWRRRVTFQRVAVRFRPATARVRPSGANATESTAPVSRRADSGRGLRTSVVFQMRTVPCSPPVARVPPSGLKASVLT